MGNHPHRRQTRYHTASDPALTIPRLTEIQNEHPTIPITSKIDECQYKAISLNALQNRSI